MTLLMKKLILIIVMLLTAEQVLALQLITVADGKTVIGKLSLKEVTRIGVVGGRIKQVVGPDDGRIRIEVDEDNGQLFLRPQLNAPISRSEKVPPVNLFIVDELGRTYTLVLTYQDMPADSIMLKPLESDRKTAKAWERAEPYQVTIKNLVRAMAAEDIPDGYETKESNQQVPLWREARLLLEREYHGDSLMGEVYVLTNISGREMRLEERELYRAGVLAVAVEYHVLAPGQSTKVFVVREGLDDV